MCWHVSSDHLDGATGRQAASFLVLADAYRSMDRTIFFEILLKTSRSKCGHPDGRFSTSSAVTRSAARGALIRPPVFGANRLIPSSCLGRVNFFFSPRLRASKQIRLLSTTATGFSSNWITNELKATGSFVQLKRNPRADFETIFGTEGVTSIIDSLIKVGCVCVCAEWRRSGNSSLLLSWPCSLRLVTRLRMNLSLFFFLTNWLPMAAKKKGTRSLTTSERDKVLRSLPEQMKTQRPAKKRNWINDNVTALATSRLTCERHRSTGWPTPAVPGHTSPSRADGGKAKKCREMLMRERRDLEQQQTARLHSHKHCGLLEPQGNSSKC